MRQSHLDVVTGGKIFARDLRAPDINHISTFGNSDWGPTTLRALYLRASLYGHKIKSIDTDTLAARGIKKCLVKLPPDQDGWCVFKDLFTGKRAATFKDKKNDYLAPIGQEAKYVGQPVCLLLFDDTVEFLDAQREKSALASVIHYEESDQDVDDSFESGEFLDKTAGMFEKNTWPPDNSTWGKWLHKGAISGEEDYKPEVSRLLNNRTGKVISFVTKTGAVDTGHLEPDSALGRVVRQSQSETPLVELIVPTQSQSVDLNYLTDWNQIQGFEFKFLPCRLGGGFGGRSTSPFHYFAALAVIAGDGLPVRLEYDRLEQFVAGIKRHSSRIETKFLLEENGDIAAFESNVLMDGGSVKNLSKSVAKLSRHSTLGAYRTKAQTGRAAALKNSGVLSGSMRGFGIPQALFNTEQQIDRIAVFLGSDPILYRKSIAIQTGDPDIDGRPHMHPIKNEQVLDVAAGHSHWKGKSLRKKNFSAENSGSCKRLGTGVAFAMEAYGTSKDFPAIGLFINEALQIEIDVFPVRMGQGTVDGIEDIVRTSFGALPVILNTGQGEKLSRIFKTMVDTNAAAKGTFGTVHVFRELLDIWLSYVWGPVILEALGRAGDQVETEKISFGDDGRIRYEDLGSVSYSEIAKKIRDSSRSQIYGLAKFKNTWAYGEFDFSGDGDANDPRWLASVVFRDMQGKSAPAPVTMVIDPTKPDKDDNSSHFEDKYKPYRSLFASAACMVDVVVDDNGSVELNKVTVVLDAGTRLSDERIKAQIEGGIAQGIGHTLFETYPAGPLGGQRQTNFDRYAMPRLRHMPAQGIEVVFLDLQPGEPVLNPIDNTTPHKPKIDLPKELYKGISEVSISPIAPAIANAIIDATFIDKKEAHDRRFKRWPITSTDVLERMRSSND